MTFEHDLRALLEKATPGPWTFDEAFNPEEEPVIWDGSGAAVTQLDTSAADDEVQIVANAALIVHLRNRASEVAALVEAARALTAAMDAEMTAPWDRAGNIGHCHQNPPQWDDPRRGTCRRCEAFMAVRAALEALDTKEETSNG